MDSLPIISTGRKSAAGYNSSASSATEGTILDGWYGQRLLATILAFQLGDLSMTGPEVAGSAVAQDAYSTVFGVMAFSAAVATALAFFLPGERRNRQLQTERAEEYAAATDAL